MLRNVFSLGRNFLKLPRLPLASTQQLIYASNGPNINNIVDGGREQPFRGFHSANSKDRALDSGRLGQQKVFTIPNVLTMCRIASAPAIGYFIWNGMNHQALMCFAFAAATDLFDGIIARKFNQYTDLGAILDPIADKLLLATCFISMYNVELMPLWLIKAYVMRDVLIISGGAVIRYYGFGERPNMKKYFDFQNHPTLGFEPTNTSKWNTAVQCALICYHLGFGYNVDSWSVFGAHFGSACLTVMSFSQYVFRAQYTPYITQTVKIPKGWNSGIKS